MFAQAFVLSAIAAGVMAQISITEPPTATLSSRLTSAQASAQTSITALGVLPAYMTGVDASIIGANNCETTFQIICTDNLLCGAAADVPLTMTQGSTDFRFAYSTNANGVSVQVSQSCSLAGPSGAPTLAVCVDVASASARGTQTITTSTTSVGGSSIASAVIPVTAGGDLLSAATGACTATSSTATDNAAAATGISEVYKVVVPIGAAMIGAVLL